jgi:PPOX class probable FMN-dependent enzyme
MLGGMTPTDLPAADVRRHYPPPIERALLKVLRAIDVHMRAFIARSPLVCLGSSTPEGADVTPRGDAPGFVHVLDDRTLLIPDWPGNNRLDSLSNIERNPQVALLFLVPGVNETLRVNGRAAISLDPALLERWNVGGKHPRSVLRVTVHEAYLHCGKALIRARLWDPATRIDRASLPSYGQMLKDQTAIRDSAEQIQASLEHGYANKLY